MHEPDEQGFIARFTGKGFDNANVANNPEDVLFAIDHGDGNKFNMAVLIGHVPEYPLSGVKWDYAFNIADLFAIIRELAKTLKPFADMYEDYLLHGDDMHARIGAHIDNKDEQQPIHDAFANAWRLMS